MCRLASYSLAILLLGVFAGCTTGRNVQVSAAPAGQGRLRVAVVEHLRDPFRHRPATRTYGFTVPAQRFIGAAQIRSFHARYVGTEGEWLSSRQPVAGYVRLDTPSEPRHIEFRLLEAWERNLWVEMTINGRYQIPAERAHVP